MKDVFEFDKDVETGGVINEIIGRIHLWDGNVVRVIFGPQGIHVDIRKESINSGAVVVFGEFPLQTLGSMPNLERKEKIMLDVDAMGFSKDAPFFWMEEISNEIWNNPKNLMVTVSRFKESVADVIGHELEPRLKLRFFNPVDIQPGLGVAAMLGRVVIDYVPKES